MKVNKISLLCLFSAIITACPQENNLLNTQNLKLSRANVCESHVAVCEHDMKMYCKNCGVPLYDLYGVAAKTFIGDLSGVNAGLGYVKDSLCPRAFEEACNFARKEGSIDIFAHKANYVVPSYYPKNEFPDCARNTGSDVYEDNYDSIKTEDYYIDMHAIGKNIWFNFRAIAKLRTTTNVVKIYQESVTIDKVNNFPSKIELSDSLADMKSKALGNYAEKTENPFPGKDGIYYFYTNRMIGDK